MTLQTIEYNSAEYKEMLSLRSRILREPLGLAFTEEDIRKEADDIFCICVDQGSIIGCCVLKIVDKVTLQLRQMAVSDSCQGKGVGRAILLFAEQTAREKGYKTILLHARLPARGFYAKGGYAEHGDIFVEVTIPHIEMCKNI